MIRHCVWWTLKDQAEGNSAEENAQLMKEGIESLRGIPGLSELEVSVSFLPTTTEEVQIILFTTHDDIAALRVFRTEPQHLHVVEFISKVTSSRKCIDWEV